MMNFFSFFCLFACIACGLVTSSGQFEQITNKVEDTAADRELISSLNNGIPPLVHYTSSLHGLNTTFGRREYGDRLDFYYETKKDYKLFRVVTEDVYYPIKNHTGSRITYIEVVDKRTDRNGGYVSLTAGGVGSRYATLHLKSKRNYGYHFEIKIYGKLY